MYQRLRSLGIVCSGLMLLSSVANAQLLLSGHTTGSFDDLSEDNTTVTNSADGTWATFATGIPTEGSTQSTIEFQNVDFTDVGSGEPIQIGLFDITNGVTELGSGAHTARFNVGLQLTSPEEQSVAVSSILFHIDHTPNSEGAIPDTFSVSFEQPNPVKVQDTLVQFHVDVDPADFQLAENATTQKGDITVTFTPVPEPSTYALGGAALLAGLVAWRRLRSGKEMPPAQLSAA